MIIKRRKNFSGYGEVTINGVRYVPAQVGDTLHDTMDTAEDVVSKIDQTAIGQTIPVKKKTRMVKSIISGLKGFMPKRKKKKEKEFTSVRKMKKAFKIALKDEGKGQNLFNRISGRKNSEKVLNNKNFDKALTSGIKAQGKLTKEQLKKEVDSAKKTILGDAKAKIARGNKASL